MTFLFQFQFCLLILEKRPSAVDQIMQVDDDEQLPANEKQEVFDDSLPTDVSSTHLDDSKEIQQVEVDDGELDDEPTDLVKHPMNKMSMTAFEKTALQKLKIESMLVTQLDTTLEEDNSAGYRY